MVLKHHYSGPHLHDRGVPVVRRGPHRRVQLVALRRRGGVGAEGHDAEAGRAVLSGRRGCGWDEMGGCRAGWMGRWDGPRAGRVEGGGVGEGGSAVGVCRLWTGASLGRLLFYYIRDLGGPWVGSSRLRPPHPPPLFPGLTRGTAVVRQHAAPILECPDIAPTLHLPERPPPPRPPSCPTTHNHHHLGPHPWAPSPGRPPGRSMPGCASSRSNRTTEPGPHPPIFLECPNWAPTLLPVRPSPPPNAP
jgi:hypothetical protein